MRPGDVLRLRSSNEPIEVVAIVDASGTILVRADGAEFEVARDEVHDPRDVGCACCE